MMGYKRTVSFLIILTTLFLTVSLLSSCKEKNREYNAEEVEAALVALLPECEKLNTVYYGAGINYITSQNNNGVYKEADFIHLNSLGFDTVEELKALTKRVYSEKLSEQIFKSKLNTTVNDGSSELGRYYQKYSESLDPSKAEPICIMVNTAYEAIFEDRMTYDYTSARALRSKGQLVFVEISCTVESKDGEKQIQTLEIAMYEESYGWRIASNSTFTNYNPYKDRYDELLK